MKSRVTKLGESLPNGRLFTFGIFLFPKVDRIFVLLFTTYRLSINFGKEWVGPHFGRFFHKRIWSPWLSGAAAFLPSFFSREANLQFGSGLPDFPYLIYQNGGKYTRLPQNYQMAINYTKWL
jgi:hypothetical protein